MLWQNAFSCCTLTSMVLVSVEEKGGGGLGVAAHAMSICRMGPPFSTCLIWGFSQKRQRTGGIFRPSRFYGPNQWVLEPAAVRSLRVTWPSGLQNQQPGIAIVWLDQGIDRDIKILNRSPNAIVAVVRFHDCTQLFLCTLKSHDQAISVFAKGFSSDLFK